MQEDGDPRSGGRGLPSWTVVLSIGIWSSWQLGLRCPLSMSDAADTLQTECGLSWESEDLTQGKVSLQDMSAAQP